MLAANVERAGSRGAKGSDMWNSKVEPLTAVTDLTGENRKPQDPFWSMARVRENTKSSAVSGEPSENFTPRPRLKGAVNPSLEMFHLVASSRRTLFPAWGSLTRRVER